MDKITVIIVFLNEGIEVENTVRSIRKHSVLEQVDILLINDASDDNYDYRRVAKLYQTRYYKNPYRKGISRSRDDGVNLCVTNFFILLDAHMRVYQYNWVDILISQLKQDPYCIFCCQTIPLNSIGDVKPNFTFNYGAYVDIPSFEIKWNEIDIDTQSDCYEIPCILGASYASNKKYWNTIRGYSGLKTYGFEEQLISVKSKLAGNGCKLIKSIEFGHIFRELSQVPYKMINSDFMYNKLYVISLFLGCDVANSLAETEEKKRISEIILKNIKPKVEKFYENEWNRKTFKKDISSFLEFNNKVRLLQPLNGN